MEDPPRWQRPCCSRAALPRREGDRPGPYPFLTSRLLVPQRLRPPSQRRPLSCESPHDLRPRRHRLRSARHLPGRGPSHRGRDRPPGTPPSGRVADRAPGHRALRGPGRQPGAGRGSSRAQEDGPQLLHHRVGGSREQRHPGRPDADHRPGLPPLPLGRLHDGPRPAASRFDTPLRHAAGHRGLGRGSHRTGPPQGVGQPPPVGPAADLDHRQPPSKGHGPGLLAGTRPTPGRGRRPPSRRRRDGLLRRRVGEPRHRPFRDQHRPLRGEDRAAHAHPVRLRGQRHRDQRPHAPRLDRRHLLQPVPPALLARGRRARRDLGDGRGRDRLRAQCPTSRLPAPADRAAVGPRRQRCGARLPGAP